MKFLSPMLSLLVLVTITTFPGCFTFEATPTNLSTLPPLTYEGKNTIGFLVDGQPHFNTYEEEITGFWNSGMLTLTCTLEETYLEMHIFVPGTEPAHRVIDENNLTDDASFRHDYSCEFRSGANGRSGNVFNVHLRRADWDVVSGTFSMTAADSCGTAIITQGRFDISVRVGSR